MRALVTGGAGFIGSAVARALLERGDEVGVFDNFLTGSSDRMPEGAHQVVGDLRDPDAVRSAMDGVEVVFHQGALPSVPRSVADPALANACNVQGTLNVLVGARDAGVRRVVYASSSSVYGDTGADVQREDLAPQPLSPYGVSKLAGEYYCSVWTRLLGLSTVSLRYFNVFGPRQDPESQYAAVFPTFCAKLLRGEAPEVHWDGEQSRDFTFIDDVVAANLAAGDVDDRADGAIVNIAGGRPKTINEVLSAVSDAVGRWIEPRRLPRRPGDIRTSRADLTRAREVLGWEPKVPWSDAVARTVAWFSQAGSGAVNVGAAD
jgi:nucleoside-diphosphate-sugar epimerase